MLSLSVCMIAKNEENNIERCLQALQAYPFEIIVVDTGSDDRTKEIALKYTDKVYDFVWTNDFSAARNFSVSKASNDWILALDCDEYIDSLDMESLFLQLSSNPDCIGSILIKNLVKNDFHQEAIAESEVSRVFNRKLFHYQNIIHEQIVPVDSIKQFRRFKTGISIFHTGYIGSDNRMAEKQNRNIELLKLSLESCQEKFKPYLYFQLGQSYKGLYLYSNDEDKLPYQELSYTCYEKALSYPIDPAVSYYRTLVVQYGYALYYKNKFYEAIAFLEDADHLSSDNNLTAFADYVYLLGFLHTNCANYEAALRKFHEAISLSDYFTEGVNSYLCYYNMGQIYECLGQWNQALGAYSQCAAYADVPDRLERVKYKLNHPTPVSICMIAKNEETYIDECMQRLIPLNCEIIFVDTGSTDQTVTLASRYTPHIYHYAWNDDFSAARNHSISKASNDWILIVDCDEFLNDTEELYHSLPAFLTSAAAHNREVGIVMINSKATESSCDIITSSKTARFFSKSHFHFEGLIHEQVLPLLEQEIPPRFMTPFTFLHFGYDGEEITVRKSARNIPLLKKQLEQSGPSAYYYYQLGKEYYSIKDWQKACYYLDAGLSMEIDPAYEYVHQMVETYGYALLELNRFQEALGLEGVYETFSRYSDFVFLMGLIYMKNGLLKEALNEFQKAVSITNASVYGVNSFKAYYNMGVIYECTGHTREAIYHYTKCGDYQPALNRLEALVKL